MAKQMKVRRFAGSVCDQAVYYISDRVKDAGRAKPRVRFKDEAERAEHRRQIARRHHAQVINENYGPSSYYSTLTLDNDHEVHTFEEARKVRDRYYNRLKNAYPDAKMHIYMGRGKTTNRIHFHMLSDGIPKEFVEAQWKYGPVKQCVSLRENCRYNGVDCGQDYTGLANYLFDHWTEEQGGRVRYKYSRKTIRIPEAEPPTECKVAYSPQHPPKAPKGYIYIRCDYNKYGYMCFHYVRPPEKKRRRSED